MDPSSPPPTILGSASCSTEPHRVRKLDTMFIHTVYFWLNDGVGEDVRRRMLTDCVELMSRIPAVRQVWSGEPAMTPREVVDNSYSVGLCVVLDDANAHDEYQAHPMHKEFLSRYKQFWKKIQVYDFL